MAACASAVPVLPSLAVIRSLNSSMRSPQCSRQRLASTPKPTAMATADHAAVFRRSAPYGLCASTSWSRASFISSEKRTRALRLLGVSDAGILVLIG